MKRYPRFWQVCAATRSERARTCGSGGADSSAATSDACRKIENEQCALYERGAFEGSARTDCLSALFTSVSSERAVTEAKFLKDWRSQPDSNRCYSLERAMSWASRRWERTAGPAGEGAL